MGIIVSRSVKALFRIQPGIFVGGALAATMLVPTWVPGTVQGVPIDFRVVAAAALMIAYSFHPAGRILSRINAVDFAVAGLVVTHVLTEWMHGGLTAGLPLRAYGEWALPYVAGRYAVLSIPSSAAIAPWFTAAGCLIGLGACLEAFTGTNLWEVVFGAVDDLVSRGSGKRYDLLYRAMGPTRHPIFLGIVLLLLVPWAAALATDERSGRRRSFGWVGLLCIALGVLSTVSRGPVLSLLIATLVVGGFYVPLLRWVLFGGTLLSVMLAVLAGPQVIEILDRTERRDQQSRVIELDGEFQQYTGTRNRMFVVKIYGPLLLRGGPLGYGTEAVSSFPPNLPGLPVSSETRATLGIVDNSYILIGLRFGWLGLGFLVMLLGTAVVTAFFLASRQSLVTYPNGPMFLVALGGILVAVSIEILTVFSSYEFFFWLLFTCGVVSGLATLDAKIRRDQVQIA